ncbi:hypothetical protein AJ80_06934 [Polytolypa hystricis UAMH7299]|uniref:Uncharacterized protein n=1 Tax=Polytolypa hystricis (strain UAMH7299) TaxID=1447883 RepID=A0A2B7XSD2_POLH7|nr:hypothetical protein AJ80_06934 [Polytolypa hystricis UAMH7299]
MAAISSGNGISFEMHTADRSGNILAWTDGNFGKGGSFPRQDKPLTVSMLAFLPLVQAEPETRSRHSLIKSRSKRLKYKHTPQDSYKIVSISEIDSRQIQENLRRPYICAQPAQTS